MNLTNKRRAKMRGWVLVMLALGGCSGPMAPSMAIRSEDRRDYDTAIGHDGRSSKETFLRWRADLTGISFEEALIVDVHLRKNPFDQDDSSAVSLGAVIYNANCRSCHGSDAKGDGLYALSDHPPKDFRSFGARLQVAFSGGPPSEWFDEVRSGEGPTVQYSEGESRAMPAFAEKLSNEQIWLVLNYLASSDRDAD